MSSWGSAYIAMYTLYRGYTILCSYVCMATYTPSGVRIHHLVAVHSALYRAMYTATYAAMSSVG
jgi:hypothetical protein